MPTPQNRKPTVISAPSLRCPKEAGGCGRDYSFRIALGPGPRRGVANLFAECTGCGRKFSFVLASSSADITSGKATGPVDLTGAPIKIEL